MKKFTMILSLAIISLGAITAYSSNAQEKSYKIFETNGWIGNGDKTEYAIGFDQTEKFNGKKSIYIEAKTDKVKSDFSTLIQSISADKYLGKRVRFSGYVKTKNANEASLWMRVDGENGKTLQFDNMYKREVKGSTDWAKYNVVLDIPTDSQSIVLGGFLAGTGKAWFDNFNIEIVDKSVPSTNIEKEIKIKEKNPNKEFKNLSFEL